MEVTDDRNMACSRVGNLWVVAAGSRRIEDATWRQYLGYSAATVTSSGPFHGILFWSLKQGPSTRQRKMLTAEFAQAVRLDDQRRVALISESALVRGTITAINWLARKKMAAFAEREIARALDWLAEDVAFDRAQAQSALDQAIGAVQGLLRKNGTSHDRARVNGSA
jgi:hypothetical protein